MSDHLEEFKDVMDKAHVEYTKNDEPKESMTEPKFTPGPWHVGRGHELSTGMKGWKYYPVCWSPDDECVCDIVYNKADAHLIAAAPKMYEALQKIASMTPGTSCDTDDGCSYYESECGTCYEMIGIAQDALRKARGESEVSE